VLTIKFMNGPRRGRRNVDLAKPLWSSVGIA
jgi:hypothetical protein